MDEQDAPRTFSDVLRGLHDSTSSKVQDDEPDAEESAEEASVTAPDASDPEQESQEAADKPTDEPEPTEEPEPSGPETAEEAEPEPTDEGDEEPAVEGEPSKLEEEAEPAEEEEGSAFEPPEGFKLTDEGELVWQPEGADEPIPADELTQGYLRQSDYTRKTQQLARQREELQQAQQDRRKLVREINSHDGMREFVSKHPDAMEYLLESPDDTRALMRNQEQFQSFVNDYETLQENPNLAEAYLRQGDEESARQQLQTQRTVQQAVGFAQELDNAVEQIAQAEPFADVIGEEDVEAVKDYVLEIGGLEEGMDPQQAMQGLQRLANVFVTPDGQQLDMQLVVDRFDAIKRKKLEKMKAEEEEVEEHNKKVDEELEEQKKRPPATPEGDGAAASPEKIPEKENFHEVLRALE